MYSYSFQKYCNTDRLRFELGTELATLLSHITGTSSTTNLHFTVELTSEQQTSLTTIITNHVVYSSLEYVQQAIEAAMLFGVTLVKEYSAENVLLGITQEGKTGEVLTKLAGVQLAIQAGSLYEVIVRIRAIPTDQYDTKYITAPRLLVFINKIEQYLGLPLSTEV